MLRSTAVLVSLSAATALALGCGTEPARVPTTVVVTPTSVSFSAVGQTQQLTAIVKDQRGDTMVNASVTWSSNNGAAVTVGAATGLATAVANGTAQVAATAGTAMRSVTVTVAQAAAQLVKVTADQTGTVGQALAQPLVAQVNDANEHPISGVTVSFAAGLGSGTVGSASAVSGADGRAQTTWTLGTVAGEQTAAASVAALPNSPVTFGATAEAGAAASVAKRAGGDNQASVAGSAVATAPSVLVRDAYNNFKSGVSVTFAVASGGGSATGTAAVTNASGVAQVGSWTLGQAGTNTLTATVSGTGITGNPATFTATAMPATGAANVAVLVGDNQTGLVGFALNVRPAVRVTDVAGAPVAGASVTFAVSSGGGSATGTTVITNGGGVAQVGNWVLGSSAGANGLTATVSGTGIAGNPVTFAATAEAAAFNIAIQNVGPAFSPDVQAAFEAAAAKWQRIIYRDIPNWANLSVAAGECGSWVPAVGPVNVDDVLIIVKVDSIDGTGRVLGSAGPCAARPDSWIPILGVMRFDSADIGTLVAAGQLEQTIAHEMAHVLGFGTLWALGAFNCVQDPSNNPPGTVLDTYFSCPRGRAMFDSIGGTSYTGGRKVPVENCGPASPAGCGTGTVNGHWREPVLVNELMTGYLTVGVANPLSRLSAAAMEDLGYGVNYAGSEAYSQTFSLRAAGAAEGTLFLGGDIYAGPLFLVESGGRVVRVIRPGARR